MHAHGLGLQHLCSSSLNLLQLPHVFATNQPTKQTTKQSDTNLAASTIGVAFLCQTHYQHNTAAQAAAHGVPTVATCNGGPVDIMKTLHHGVVVDPTNPDAIAAELVRIVTTPELWDSMSNAGRANIMAYSWPSHCVRYLETVEAEKRRAMLCRVRLFAC